MVSIYNLSMWHVTPGDLWILKNPCIPWYKSHLVVFYEPLNVLLNSVCQYLLRNFASVFTRDQSVQFSSVAQLCLTLCNPMDCSMLGLPVHHQLLEFTQTHVHWVSDAIQPSHFQSSPSPPALNLSHHQCLFKWVSSLHQVAKVLEFQLQHQFFQWIFRTDFLWDGSAHIQLDSLRILICNFLFFFGNVFGFGKKLCWPLRESCAFLLTCGN